MSVVLDVDPEVCRLGYGAEEALDVLQGTACELGQPLCEQPGIRIGVLIVDNKTLVYSPTPLLVESNTPAPVNRPKGQDTLFPTEPTPLRPNAVLLQGTPPELAHDLGTGPDGESTRTVGLDQVAERKVQELKADLQSNPPLKFDIARYERVFNSQLEFVELEVLGCSVSQHTAAIPADLMGLAKDKETRDRLRSSFKVVGQTDSVGKKGKLTEQALKAERKRIADAYLVVLRNYGTVILRANRPKFEQEIVKFRKLVAEFAEKLKTKLDTIIGRNVRKLSTALFPAVKAKPPERWTRTLGPNPTKEQLRGQLDADLRAAFGDATSLVSEMKVNLLFKGITYQTLTDLDFRKLVREKFPSLRLMDEYDAVRGTKK